MTRSGLSPESVVIPVAAVVGLFVGSFLNVVVYRAPLGLSVSTPRSFCPTCDRQLGWWENVPLLSWLFLRGRCHTCRQPISARYPVVEATTAVMFALVAWAWRGTLPTAGYCALSATALSIALVECGGRRAPLSIGAVGTAIGALLLVPGLLVTHRGPDLAWAFVGLAAGTILLGMLRARDPDCGDPLTHGRTALPLAGMWLGGLGWRPAVAGLVAWVFASFFTLLVFRLERIGRRDDGDVDPGGGVRIVTSVATVPLVVGIAAALAVSLCVAA